MAKINMRFILIIIGIFCVIPASFACWCPRRTPRQRPCCSRCGSALPDTEIIVSSKPYKVLRKSGLEFGATTSRPAHFRPMEQASRLFEEVVRSLPVVMDTSFPVEIPDRSLPAEMDRGLPVEMDRNVPVEMDRSLPVEMDRSLPVEMDRSLPVEMDRNSPVEMDRGLPVEMVKSLSAESNRNLPIEMDRGFPVEMVKSLSVEMDRRLPEEMDRRLPEEIDRRIAAGVDRRIAEDVNVKLATRRPKSNLIIPPDPSEESDWKNPYLCCHEQKKLARCPRGNIKFGLLLGACCTEGGQPECCSGFCYQQAGDKRGKCHL